MTATPAAGPLTWLQSALAEATTPERVYEVVLKDLAEALGASGVTIGLLDATGEWIEIVGHRGYREEVVTRFSRFRADADVPLADAVRRNCVLVVRTADEVTRRYSGVTSDDVAPGRLALACEPLRASEHVIGAIGLSFSADLGGTELNPLLEEGGSWTGAALSRCLSDRSVSAVQSLVDAARSRLAFLSAATRELSRSLDRDAVLDTLTQLVVPRFADWASVLLAEGDELVAATLVHRDHLEDDPRQRAGRFRFPTSAPTVSGEVYRTGRPSMVAGIDDDVRSRMAAYPELRESLAATRLRLVVPITAAGRILGIITLGDTGHSSFDEDDLTVAVELAARAGTALDNATRFETERNMVEVLQRAVLPTTLPADDAYELTARYLPSTIGAKVGGDWYDAFALRDGRLGLCIGDVVGHGIEAAACMGQLRNALRAYALDGEGSDVVVAAINEYAIDTATTDFTTLIYAVYDPSTGKLEWTSAGHPPMLCRRSSGVEILTAGHGLPIGIVRREYGRSSTQLDTGDLVVAFSDGLVEYQREPMDRGVMRISDALEDHRERGTEEVIDQLVAPLASRERVDDVCVLMLEHCP